MANMYNISGLNYYTSTNRSWFAKAIFGGDLIDRGKILPLENVKESTDLNLFELVGKILQRDSRNCAWTPEQIIKLTNKTLQVITYKVNLEQCIDDLESKNTVWMLKAGAKNDSLPSELEELTMERVAQQIAEEIETLIFAGNSTNVDEFDGVVQTLIKSSDSIKLQGVELAPQNVAGEIQKLYLAIPKAVRAQGKKDGTLCIYTSYEVVDFLTIALSGINGGNVIIYPNFTISGDNTIKYLGVEIVPVLGLNDSTMVATNWTNLILGTDLISDTQSIRLGQFPAPNDSKIYIDGRLRLGFALPFDNEAVIYSPDVTTTPASRVAPLASKTTPKVAAPLASEQIEKINAATTVDEVNDILGSDTRATVVKAANDKITELSKTE